MKTAYCVKCGFRMRGQFRGGAPLRCPACGYGGSQQEEDSTQALLDAMRPS